MENSKSLWSLLSNGNNGEILVFIGIGVVVAIAAIWKVFIFFYKFNKNPAMEKN